MKNARITNLVILIFNSILTTLAIIKFLGWLIIYFIEDGKSTDSNTIGSGLAIVFILIYAAILAFVVICLILSICFYKKIKNNITRKVQLSWGIPMLIFGFIVNGILILCIPKSELIEEKNKSENQI